MDFVQNDIDSGKIYGDVTSIGRDFKVKSILFFNVKNGLYGTLDNIGYTMDKLERLVPPVTTDVTLTIENLVAKARKIGVTTKENFDIQYCYTCNTIFNGARVEGGYGTHRHNYLSWTPTTITFVDSNGTPVTIENSDVEP